MDIVDIENLKRALRMSMTPYPLSLIVAAIRRKMDIGWMERWRRYAAQNNVKPF